MISVSRDDTQYGPEKICQRTACTAEGPADHVGGAHLDPYDREHFDGNEISLRATTYRVRDQLSRLHYATRDASGDLTSIVDVAIHAALEEIRFLKDQATHVQVDADRKVREASRQALDCEHHGKTIQQLEEQLTAVDRTADKTEKARLALLSGIKVLDDTFDALDATIKAGRPLPDVPKLVTVVRASLKKTYAAHARAWSK